jgi:hypothetical protein
VSQQPARVSHELEDFSASGIYPGGTNMITDAGYVLWDYNGKQPPNSNCAMKLTCQPTDGSNENKAHDIYWNIGLAKDFIPEGDGAFVLGDKPMSQQCNWFFALSKFRDNCGLEKGRLSGDKGVKALIGSEVTFIRVPHERAEFGNDPAMPNPSGGPARPKQAPTILIPSKARFAWETAKGAAARAAAKPAAAASASTPPPASTNGAGDTSSPLYMAISSILAENDNAVMVADLAAKVTEKLSVVQGMSAAKRVVLIKTVNDPAKLAEFAAANGWQLDTQEGVLLIP